MSLTTAVLAVFVAGCASPPMSPANVAIEPGGVLAVSFTRTFPAGFWDPGGHAYRLVIVCPTQRIGPPVVRFEVTEDAAQFGEVYLRFDGPGTSPLSPADLVAIHPADTTVAVVTLAGMTESDAEEARSECEATVVYDGQEPDELEPGMPFSP